MIECICFHSKSLTYRINRRGGLDSVPRYNSVLVTPRVPSRPNSKLDFLLGRTRFILDWLKNLVKFDSILPLVIASQK